MVRRRVAVFRAWLAGLVLGLGLGATTSAGADDSVASDPDDVRAPAQRPVHGSFGIGSALLLTGERGDRFRVDVTFDLKWRSRYGVLVAARAGDVLEDIKGLVMAGVIFEAAAARPRLVLDLHASAGADLDHRAPLVGGGLRTTLAIYKLLGVAIDSGAYLVIDGLDDTRLQIQSTTSLVARW